MMYYTFTVGGNDYKLRLSTRNTVALEKKIGCNPLMIFGNGDRVPSVTDMERRRDRNKIFFGKTMTLYEILASGEFSGETILKFPTKPIFFEKSCESPQIESYRFAPESVVFPMTFG